MIQKDKIKEDITIDKLIFVPDDKVKEYINYCVNIVKEIKIYGTYILDLVNKENKELYSDLPLLFILRDYIELLDTVEVLYNSSCVRTSTPILRNMFEIMLQIIYIFDGNTDRKGLTYHVGYLHYKLDWLKRVDINHKESKKVKEQLNGMNIKKLDVGSEIKSIETALSKEPYKNIEKEWIKNENRNRYFQWYSLFNGAKTIKALAIKYKYEFIYNSLYSMWSRDTHGVNALSALNIDNKSEVIENLRVPEEMGNKISLVCSMSLEVFLQYVKYYLTKDDLDNYRDFYLTISKKRDAVKDVKFQVEYL